MIVIDSKWIGFHTPFSRLDKAPFGDPQHLPSHNPPVSWGGREWEGERGGRREAGGVNC